MTESKPPAKRRPKKSRDRGTASLPCPKCGAASEVLRTGRGDSGVERQRKCLSCENVFFSTEAATVRIKSENPKQAPGSAPSSDPDYMCTARELATWLQCSDVQVRKMVPRRSGAYEYRLSDVMRWLETKTVDPATKWMTDWEKKSKKRKAA